MTRAHYLKKKKLGKGKKSQIFQFFCKRAVTRRELNMGLEKPEIRGNEELYAEEIHVFV